MGFFVSRFSSFQISRAIECHRYVPQKKKEKDLYDVAYTISRFSRLISPLVEENYVIDLRLRIQSGITKVIDNSPFCLDGTIE